MIKAMYWHWLPWAAAMALAAGCATQGASWSSTDQGERTARVGGYSIEVPAGWMQLKGEARDSAIDRQILSRDGTNLQFIEITRAKPEEAFPRLKRGAPAGALPSELAELQIANMQGPQGLGSLDVVRNEPVSVAGTAGYRLQVRFRNGRGLRYERIVVGFADPEGYYTLAYQAPTLHYFARDRETFDALVRSVRASERKPG